MNLPLSWFAGVPFAMILPKSRVAPDWTPQVKRVTHEFLSTNVHAVEIIGQGRMRLSALCRFESSDEFAAFMAAIDTEDTLTMRYGATAYPGDTDGEDLDGLYKTFAGVLPSPDGPPRLHRNGEVDLDVTFERDAP